MALAASTKIDAILDPVAVNLAVPTVMARPKLGKASKQATYNV